MLTRNGVGHVFVKKIIYSTVLYALANYKRRNIIYNLLETYTYKKKPLGSSWRLSRRGLKLCHCRFVLQFLLTPLHLAAWYGRESVVELLLQHGADVNAVDRVSWFVLRVESQSLTSLCYRGSEVAMSSTILKEVWIASSLGSFHSDKAKKVFTKAKWWKFHRCTATDIAHTCSSG